MIKNLLLAAVFLVVGYVAAVFFPMPQPIEQDLHSLVGQVETEAQEATQTVEGAVAEGEAKVAGMEERGEQEGELSTKTEDGQQATEEEQDYFVQSDLLFHTKDSAAKSTLVLGAFKDEAVADNEINSLNINDQVNKFPFKLPTGTKATLVTIGEYETEGEATKAKMALEAKHDLNLLVVKFPTKEAPPPKTDEEIVDAVIDALQASKQPTTKQ